MGFTMVTTLAVMVLISHMYSANGANLTAFAGQISYLTSPNYPLNYYDNTDLQWMIDSTSRFIVKVTILNATMEPCCDFVQIFDGMSTSSPTLVKFYSMPNQTVYSSSGQYMYIRFYTDGSFTYFGFRLTYEAIPISSQIPTSTKANLTAPTVRTSGPIPTTTTANPAVPNSRNTMTSTSGPTITVTTARTAVPTSPATTASTSGSAITAATTRTSANPAVQTSTATTTSRSGQSITPTIARTTANPTLTSSAATAASSSGPTTATTAARTSAFFKSGPIPTTTTASPTVPTSAATTASTPVFNAVMCSFSAATTARTSGPIPTITTANPAVTSSAATTARTSGPTTAATTARSSVPTSPATTTSTKGPIIAATTARTSGSILTTTIANLTVSNSTATTRSTPGPTITATTTRTSGPIPTTATVTTSTPTTASTLGPSTAATTARTSGPIPTTTTANPTVVLTLAPTTARASGPTIAATTARTSGPIQTPTAANPAVTTSATTTARTSGPTIAIATTRTSGPIPITTTASLNGQTILRATAASSTGPTFTSTTVRTSGSSSTTTTGRSSDTTPTSTTAATSVCSVNASSLNVLPGQVGYLTSPNYPSPYYNNADCRWLINAGSGYLVKISLTEVNLESGWDYLELYNGNEVSNSFLIVKTSSMPSQTVYYSSGKFMSIRFYSDVSVTYTGFRLTYEAIDQQPVSTSGPTLTTTAATTSIWSYNETTLSAVVGQVGYLTSPNYQFPYYSYIERSWTINSTSGYVVKATLLNATSDFYFYIAIYDGMSETSPLLAWIYGVSSQTVYYSSGQSMYIRFYTYGIGPNSFFSLTYEAVDQMSSPRSMCSFNGTTLSAAVGQVGYLSSPYYPSVYYGFIPCLWTINSISGYVVKATVLNITSSEFYFYITIYDGMSESAPLIAQFSSISSQTVYYSSGQSMYISLMTYGVSPNSSFRLTYEAVHQLSAPTSVCSVNKTNLSAAVGQVRYLSSLYYPSVYDGVISCSWTIISASGYVVKTTVINVTNPGFFFYIGIYDGMSESSSSIGWIYSMPLQTVYYSSRQSMYIKLYTYGLGPNASLNLTYEAVDQLSSPTSVCSINGTNLTAEIGQVGYLSSPYYPSVYYGFLACSWTINSISGYVVRATLLSVTYSDFYFYITIYDGMSDSAPSIAQFTTMPSQTVYYSSGQSMFIRLYTYGLGPNSSFRLTYEAVDPRSGTTLASTTSATSGTTFASTTPATSVCPADAPTLYAVPGQVGYLTSPNYPSPYYNNADCRWLINAGSGKVVKVSVTNVNLETCCDYLELYSGNLESSSMLIARIYSMPSQTVYNSSGQYMYIRFHSDGSVTYSGFSLTYEAIDQESVSTYVCPVNGTALSALPGQVDYLRFPNQPSGYSNNTDCRWLINSTTDNVVKLTVLGGSSDFYYYIQIFDGMSESSPTLVTFYGMPPQTVYNSSRQYMYIKFTGYGFVTNSGLRVSYEAVNQPSVTTPGPTVPTPTYRTSDPCTCTCSCVSTCSRP